VLIRLAAPGDAEAIRAIYNAEIAGGTNTFDLVARSRAEQDAWLARHRGAHPAIVAVEEAPATLEGSEPGTVRGTAGELVLGFGSLSPYRSRPAYATTVEDSIYVAERHQGRGVGRALLHELIRLAQDHGFHAVIARIVGANGVSIGLHKACGFGVVGTEREVGRKHGRWLDVIELQRLL
jgi:L-amino acid N-acyltransferase YncA